MKAIDNPDIKRMLEYLPSGVARHMFNIIDAHTKAAVLAEREACAVIAETDTFGNHEYKGADEIAKEIRAR